ncbi:MAG: hypothetical protein AAB036_00815 [Elusimicrobiota bacterium]
MFTVLSVLCVCVVLPFQTPSALAAVKAGGTLKNFWQYSHSALDGRAYNLNTARARLSLDADTSYLRAHIDYDHQVAAGSFFRTTEYRLFGLGPPAPWLEMQQTISTGTTNGWGHGAYRAWVGVEDERGAVRVGRQRVAWGTGKLWNPTDVLNPYNPLTFERDERPGVDALYGRAGVGDLGQAELAWAPRDRWVDHSLLMRGRANWEGWDASALGGKIAGSTGSFLLGGDFAGDLFEGTLHGEAAWFNPETRPPYWKAGLGYDYSFKSEAAILVEIYHAGNGRMGATRNYAGATFSKDINPLLKLEAVAIANADDGSTFFMPSLTWNALNDLHLTAAMQRFGGEKTTEYGRVPNSTILTAQFWF